MNNSQFNDVRFVVENIFATGYLGQEDDKNLNIVKDVLKDWSIEDKNSLMDLFFYQDLPFDNLLSFYFYLLDLSGDPRFLKKLDQEILGIKKISEFYEVFWNMARRGFVNKPGYKMTHNLRYKFHELSRKANVYIYDRMQVKPSKIKGIKRIAILSPQILGMRHSPTREAFSLACHLKRNHDSEVYIINTNSMVYASNLNIHDAFIANVNRSLVGEQEISIDYLGFKSEKLKIFSWPACPMNLQKIMDIQDVIHGLNVDAVISHADNLFIQEACYGMTPSLFVTTGGVVPFAHSDGYWVPGNLMSDEHRTLACAFGHSNFLNESMIVTPEGIAEVPASRKGFNISKNAFIYLVVSTRLNDEMDAEFAAICEKILSDASGAVILFVGTPDFNLSQHFAQALIENNRVINGGFCENLAEVCLMSSVYLNPKRQGGGTSAQTAIINGLPVVTLDYGHISAVVPEDYRQRNWDDYMLFANRLFEDADFLVHQRDKFLLHFKKNLSIDHQVSKIYTTLESIARNKYS